MYFLTSHAVGEWVDFEMAEVFSLIFFSFVQSIHAIYGLDAINRAVPDLRYFQRAIATQWRHTNVLWHTWRDENISAAYRRRFYLLNYIEGEPIQQQ